MSPFFIFVPFQVEVLMSSGNFCTDKRSASRSRWQKPCVSHLSIKDEFFNGIRREKQAESLPRDLDWLTCSVSVNMPLCLPHFPSCSLFFSSTIRATLLCVVFVAVCVFPTATRTHRCNINSPHANTWGFSFDLQSEHKKPLYLLWKILISIHLHWINYVKGAGTFIFPKTKTV